MPNRFFNNIIDLFSGSKAKASDIEAHFNLITTGFDGVQTEMDTKVPFDSPLFISADEALAAANYKGDWSLLTGALNKPASVSYAGTFWVLGADLANVTTAVPGVSASWVPIIMGSIPQNSKSAAYTTALTDAGKHILHPSADTTARMITIPANSAVPYPIGTVLTIINQNGAGVLTLSITSDVMRWSPSGTTGSRSLAANGIATLVKLTATEWILNGMGLS